MSTFENAYNATWSAVTAQWMLGNFFLSTQAIDGKWASQVAQLVKKPPAMQETQETWVQSLGWGDSLEKEMATHSNWKIPWTDECGKL